MQAASAKWGLSLWLNIKCGETLSTLSYRQKLIFIQIFKQSLGTSAKSTASVGMNITGAYHELYHKMNVLLSTKVLENFRWICYENYELDPARFFTTPGWSWDAILHKINVDLEFLTHTDVLLMTEKEKSVISVIPHIGIGRWKYFFQGKANSGEVLFYLLETNKATFFPKNVKGKCQISKPIGPQPPCHPFRRPWSYVEKQKQIKNAWRNISQMNRVNTWDTLMRIIYRLANIQFSNKWF